MSIWLVLGMVLCLLMAYPLEAAKRPLPVRIGKGIVKVNYLEGQAQARVATQERWQDLKVGQILRGGDEVQVGKGSKLELRLPDGSMLRFCGTVRYFRIDSAPDKDAPDVDVHLMVGEVMGQGTSSGRGEALLRDLNGERRSGGAWYGV